MTKAELVTLLLRRLVLPRRFRECSRSFRRHRNETLAKGDSIQLVGFGTFEVRERAAREGINPRTKEKIEIAATKVPAFKAGRALKDAVSE